MGSLPTAAQSRLAGARPCGSRSSGSREGSWARYRDNLPRHLMGVSRDLQSRVMRSLSEDRGHRALRLSFGPFLSLLWDEARSLTAIAGELAISKQACSQLANLAERAGYLARRANPEDKRSKVATLTRQGRALVEQGAQLILAAESEYAGLVGAQRYRRFTAALADLYQGLGLPARAASSPTEAHRQSAGLLPLIVQRVQQELMEATIARGHAGLKMSHGQVLPLIGPYGGHIHEIARIQRVSRQAISAISQDLEALGYLRRAPDPLDRRGVVLTLTPRGVALIADSVAAVDDLDVSFRDVLGAKELAHLQNVARDLYHALHLEEEIFEVGSGNGPDTPGAGSRSPRRPGRDIEQLARGLRRQLGSGDVARLAELLDSGSVHGELLDTRARRTAT